MNALQNSEKCVENVILLKTDMKSVRFLIAWIKQVALVDIKLLDELRSGVVYCRIMNKLFPRALQLSKINFDAENEGDFKTNFFLLKRCFDKLEIIKDIPLNELCQGRGHLEFVKWLYKFYQVNAHEAIDHVNDKDRIESIRKTLAISSVAPRKAVDSDVVNYVSGRGAGESLLKLAKKPRPMDTKNTFREIKCRQIQRLIVNHKKIATEALQQINRIDLNRSEVKESKPESTLQCAELGKKLEILQNISFQHSEHILQTMQMIRNIVFEDIYSEEDDI